MPGSGGGSISPSRLESIFGLRGIMDSGHLREVKEIEIAHLKLRYAHTRIYRPERISSLASSIERFGQIIPVIALREGMRIWGQAMIIKY